MSIVPGDVANNRVEAEEWSSAPFRDWLQDHLRRLNWTKSDLARRLNAPASTITRWTNEGRQPSTQYAQLLAEIFGEDVDTVLTLAGHRPQTRVVEDPRLERIISLLRRIDLDRHDRADFLEANLRRWLAADQERAAGKREQ